MLRKVTKRRCYRENCIERMILVEVNSSGLISNQKKRVVCLSTRMKETIKSAFRNSLIQLRSLWEKNLTFRSTVILLLLFDPIKSQDGSALKVLPPKASRNLN